jgi:hypothetical protein
MVLISLLKAPLYAVLAAITDLPPTKKHKLSRRITVFENKIKSKLKGQAIGFSQITVF